MRKLALGLVLVIASGLAWRALRRDAPDGKLLFDRFWIDHEARDYREEYLALIVSGEYPVGNFQTRTAWTGRWEGFHYHLSPREDGVLDLIFPATGERQRVTVTARRCDERGFDFCLELEGAPRGAKRYYSKKGWELKGAGAALAGAPIQPPPAP